MPSASRVLHGDNLVALREMASDEIDRIPSMAPGLVGPEKAARGKLPTDTWWHTVVSPTGKEKLGYPTQKPSGIRSRIECGGD